MRYLFALFSAGTLIAQEAPSVQLVAPASWTQLHLRPQAPPSKPRILPGGAAVVEVVDQDSEASAREFRLSLQAEVQASLQVPLPTLGQYELAAFMGQGFSPRADYAKALVDTALAFWHPVPLTEGKDAAFRITQPLSRRSSWSIALR